MYLCFQNYWTLIERLNAQSFLLIDEGNDVVEGGVTVWNILFCYFYLIEELAGEKGKNISKIYRFR